MAPLVVHGQSSAPISTERRTLVGQQLDFARNVALDIGTVAEAERLGYRANYQRIDGRGWEYLNWSYMSSTFDISHPSMLVFEDNKPDSRVISMAYNVTGTKADGPPKYFPLELLPWHWHENLCSVGSAIISSNDLDRCKRLDAEVHPELNHWMIDLWIMPGWENPWGIESSKHPDLFIIPQPWYADPDYRAKADHDHDGGV